MFLTLTSSYFRLLRVKGRELLLSAFLEKTASCACLFGSELNCIFHWKAQSLAFCKSLFSSSCEVSLLKTREKRDVSSAKILQVDWIYLMKQAPRLFFENLSSKTLSLESVKLPEKEINFQRVWPYLDYRYGMLLRRNYFRGNYFWETFWRLFPYSWVSVINISLSLKWKITAIWLVETASIFLISMECETQES